jgi:hypothetical protein
MPSKPFDAALKDVIETHAADWAALLGAARPRSVRVVDADVSTVTAAADKALVVENDDGELVLHPELQSSYASDLPRRISWYNSVFHHRFALPVLSTAVLLRPEADGPAMTGRYEVRVPGRQQAYHTLAYDVLRLWRLPVEKLLTGGIGILPLAPLADDAAIRLPAVLGTIDRRLADEAKTDEAEKLRAATSVLMGLRHPPELIHHLLKGMWPMWENILEDSSIVKEYVERAVERAERRAEDRGIDRGIKIGEDRGIKIGEDRVSAKFRDALLRLGEKRLGSPDSATRAAIERIDDVDRLSALSEKVLDVANWHDLLA